MEKANRADLLALFDRQERRDIVYPDMRREVTGSVVRHVRPAPGISFISYSTLDETSAGGAIDQQILDFTSLGQRFEWRVYEHDTPSDLLRRLRENGFEEVEPEAVMLLDLEKIPRELAAPLPANVGRITRREELWQVRTVLSAVWGHSFDWIEKRLGDHLEIPGYLSVYVYEVDDKPVSVAWVYFHAGSSFAGLWGGATLPEYRRSGCYTALVAARVQEALRRGRRYGYVEAVPASQVILAKNGFNLLTYAWDCEYTG